MLRVSHSDPRRTRLLTTVLTLLVPVALVAGVATAAFKSTRSASETISRASLAAPTALGDTCSAQGLTTSLVNLSWTATASTSASGYRILRSTTTGGPYTQVGTVAGRTTTTYSDPIGLLTTEFYVVQATRATWTSPSSNQATAHIVALGICV